MKPKNKYNKYLLQTVIILYFFIIPCNHFYLNAQENDISKIINNINIDTLLKFVSELSGEVDISIDGGKYFISSRYHSSNGNILAEKYLEQKLKSYNLETSLYKVDNTITNIIGVKRGIKYPTRKYIICAHFDSYSNNPSIAPGADDNASGTSIVLEAARVLAEYNTNYTLVFALWDEEELGLKGSYGYALNAKNNNDTILGVLNIDMVGYDGMNDNKLLLNTQQNSLSFLITNKIGSINSTYDIGLKVILNYSTQLSSDHKSFISFGYPAVLMIEDEKSGDFNPYYHTVNDKISAFNINYYEKCAKVAIGAIASLVEVNKSITSIYNYTNDSQDISLHCFPNPFNSAVTINLYIPISTDIKIQIWDELGKEIDKLYDDFIYSGTHTFKWEAKHKSSSIYFITVRTPNSLITKKINLIK